MRRWPRSFTQCIFVSTRLRRWYPLHRRQIDRPKRFDAFAGLACAVIAVPVQQDTALPPGKIAEIARRIGIPAETRESVAEALAAVSELNLEPLPRILITGSLYLAGEVLAANGRR